jgi:hypothetical protein
MFAMRVQPVSRALCVLACALLLGGCATQGAVVACQAADTVTTLEALDAGAREMNPVVRYLIEEFGPEAFVAAKVGATLLVLHYYPIISADVVVFINVLTCGVAAHNAYVTYELTRRGQQVEVPEQGDKAP